MKKLFLPIFPLFLLTGCSFSVKDPSAAQSAVSDTCPGSPEVAAATLAAATKAAAAEGYEPIPYVKISEGGTLVTWDGMSLYTFKKDELCKSNCDATCAANWKPLQFGMMDLIGDKNMKGILGFFYGTFTDTREDYAGISVTLNGVTTYNQVTYNGVPLYFWKGDVNPGDTFGDGVDDVWYLAKP